MAKLALLIIGLLAMQLHCAESVRNVGYMVTYPQSSQCPPATPTPPTQSTSVTVDTDEHVIDVMIAAAESNPDSYDFKATYFGKYSGFSIDAIGGTAATDCCYWSFNYQMPGVSRETSSSLGVSLVTPGDNWTIIMSYVLNKYKPECVSDEKKEEL